MNVGQYFDMRLLINSLIILLLAGYCQADEISDILPALIVVESGGNPYAISKAGCRGLMQISEIVINEYIRETKPALDYLDYNLVFNDRFNLKIGEWYLRRLKNHYIPKDKYNIKLLLACYNAGPTRMKQLKWDISKSPKETRQYVQKVITIYKKQAKGGKG